MKQIVEPSGTIDALGFLYIHSLHSFIYSVIWLQREREERIENSYLMTTDSYKAQLFSLLLGFIQSISFYLSQPKEASILCNQMIPNKDSIIVLDPSSNK